MYSYLLHYIGQGLYNKSEFENEAKRIGVNRAFPRTILKRLKWGDQILLATYNKETKTATVFGYYDVQGITLDGDDETKQKIYKKCKIKETLDLGPSGKPIVRKCGSYTINSVHYVDDSVEEIADKINELIKEGNLKKSIKAFVYGPYHKFKTPREFSPINFTRSGVFVETDKRVRNNPTKTGHVSFIGEYQKKKYRFKREDKNKSLYDNDRWEVPVYG